MLPTTTPITDKFIIIFFDGECNFCNASVNFILKYDTLKIFRFSSLQSTFGQAFLRQHNYKLSNFDSIIIWKDNRIYEKSDAIIQIGLAMSFTKLLARIGSYIPFGLRNFLYTIFAKNRYFLFGKKQHCLLPNAEHYQRFI